MTSPWSLANPPLPRQVSSYREAAGPRVLRQLTESVKAGLESGVFSEEAKMANEELVEAFKVSPMHHHASRLPAAFMRVGVRVQDIVLFLFSHAFSLFSCWKYVYVSWQKIYPPRKQLRWRIAALQTQGGSW